jgi:hypothetical protein
MQLLKKIGSFVWSRSFLINFGALIVVYILIYVILNVVLDSSTNYGQKIKVPNLIGKNANNIDAMIGDAPLKVEVLDSIYDPKKIEGTILEQDPMPTDSSDIYVKENRVIRVRVSKRTQLVEMPDLVNKSQRFAETVLRNRNFKYRLEYKPSLEANGAVIAQAYRGRPIAPGAKIPIGSTIKVTVGRNEAGVPLPLPNLYGLSIVEAKERVDGMMNMELLIVCPDCETKSDTLSARVKSQSPEWVEDAVVASGGTITIYATKEALEENPE